MIISPDKHSYMSLDKNNERDDALSFSEFNLKNSEKETTITRNQL